MKTITRLILVCVLAASYCEGSAQTNSQEDGRLTITISGVKNNNGNILVGVGSLSDVKTMKSRSVKSDVAGVVCGFDNLSIGEQTIYVFHDENGNNVLDMSSEGYPIEGYAVAEGAGMEAYQVPVNVSNKEQQVNLKIVYLVDIIKK